MPCFLLDSWIDIPINSRVRHGLQQTLYFLATMHYTTSNEYNIYPCQNHHFLKKFATTEKIRIYVSSPLYQRLRPGIPSAIRVRCEASCESWFSNARYKGDCTGLSRPVRRARGVLAPSCPPSRRRRHKGEVEGPAC